MTAARELADLPFAAALESFTDDVERGDDIDLALFDGVAMADVDLGNVSFTECAFMNVEFGSGGCRKARFNDVWLQASRFVGTEVVESVWLDATIVSGALSGVQAFSSDWRRVLFRGCKLDSVNFRSSTLIDVTFEDCTLIDRRRLRLRYLQSSPISGLGPAPGPVRADVHGERRFPRRHRVGDRGRDRLAGWRDHRFRPAHRPRSSTCRTSGSDGRLTRWPRFVGGDDLAAERQQRDRNHFEVGHA